MTRHTIRLLAGAAAVAIGTGIFGASTIRAAAAVAGSSSPPTAADTRPATPASRPADGRVAALIDQLGSDDPAAREAATRQLEALGPDALADLRGEADAGNPEVRARVRHLIRRAERRLPPAAPPHDRRFSTQRVRVSTVGDRRTVDVDDNGYKIAIRQSPDGITMDVTGLEDGREATETYKAADADQLKLNSPEAFALYEKYRDGTVGVRPGGAAGLGGGIRFGRGLGGGAGANGGAAGNGAGAIGAGANGPAVDATRRRLNALVRQQLQDQIDDPALPEAARQQLREMLGRLAEQDRPAEADRPAGGGPASRPTHP